MNLRFLKTYIEVVKSGSFTKAAKYLYLSQASVSDHIKQLEEMEGVRLIERENRKFSLTPEGKRFLKFAEQVWHDHDNLAHDLHQMKHGFSGELKIFSTPIIGEFLLPSVLSDFKKQNPSIEVNNIIYKLAKEVVAELKNTPGSVGFCGPYTEDSDIEAIKIGQDEQVLIVHNEHPLADQKQVPIASLRGETLILRTEPTWINDFYHRELVKAKLDLNKYQPKMLLGSTTGVISAVRSKFGIGIVPYLSVKNIEELGLLKVIRIENAKFRHDLYCIYLKNIIMDPILKGFIKYVRKCGIVYLSR
jgi:DNA-binding transcriptional LysR family regulator